MVLDKNKDDKLFYKISEVAKMFNVNISAIRFWEKEFTILKPKRNKKGNRLFTKNDIKNMQIIYHLLKDRGFTVEGAKNKLKDNKTDTINNVEIVKHLKELRSFLINLKNEI